MVLEWREREREHGDVKEAVQGDLMAHTNFSEGLWVIQILVPWKLEG